MPELTDQERVADTVRHLVEIARQTPDPTERTEMLRNASRIFVRQISVLDDNTLHLGLTVCVRLLLENHPSAALAAHLGDQPPGPRRDLISWLRCRPEDDREPATLLWALMADARLHSDWAVISALIDLVEGYGSDPTHAGRAAMQVVLHLANQHCEANPDAPQALAEKRDTLTFKLGSPSKAELDEAKDQYATVLSADQTISNLVRICATESDRRVKVDRLRQASRLEARYFSARSARAQKITLALVADLAALGDLTEADHLTALLRTDLGSEHPIVLRASVACAVARADETDFVEAYNRMESYLQYAGPADLAAWTSTAEAVLRIANDDTASVAAESLATRFLDLVTSFSANPAAHVALAKTRHTALIAAGLAIESDEHRERRIQLLEQAWHLRGELGDDGPDAGIVVLHLSALIQAYADLIQASTLSEGAARELFDQARQALDEAWEFFDGCRRRRRRNALPTSWRRRTLSPPW